VTVAVPWGVLGVVLCVSACAPAPGGSTSAVFASPRSAGASTDAQGQEAIADAVESVEQILQSGRAAYASDPGRRSAAEYCRAGEDEIERGALRQAIRDKSKALYVAKQDRDLLLAAECSRSIAIAYSFAGEQNRAVDWADEAQQYLQQAGPGVDAARAAGVRGPLLKVRADAALDRGDLAQARSMLTTAQSLAPDYYRPYVLVSLAQIDLAQGNFPAADAELDAALDLPGVPDELNAIIVRTKGDVALGRGDLPGAAALFSYGARLSTQSGDTYDDAWAERGLARVEIAQGQPARATESYARAMQAAEQSRTVFRADELRSGAFGRLQAIFDEAAGTLAQQGRWQDAFDASERGRARSLRDLLRNQPGAAPARAASAQEVVAALPAGTALVSYHMLDDRLLIWTVRRSGISGVSVALRAKELEAQVRTFTSLISRPGRLTRSRSRCSRA
jgi:tetratricopeptide (TPR) repeat protein